MGRKKRKKKSVMFIDFFKIKNLKKKYKKRENGYFPRNFNLRTTTKGFC